MYVKTEHNGQSWGRAANVAFRAGFADKPPDLSNIVVFSAGSPCRPADPLLLSHTNQAAYQTRFYQTAPTHLLPLHQSP